MLTPAMANTIDQGRTGSVRDRVNDVLDEAAKRGEPVELILAVRGKVAFAPRRNRPRWRIRTSLGHVVTFRPEFVIAFNGASRAEGGLAPVEVAAVPASGGASR